MEPSSSPDSEAAHPAKSLHLLVHSAPSPIPAKVSAGSDGPAPRRGADGWVLMFRHVLKKQTSSYSFTSDRGLGPPRAAAAAKSQPANGTASAERDAAYPHAAEGSSAAAAKLTRACGEPQAQPGPPGPAKERLPRFEQSKSVREPRSQSVPRLRSPKLRMDAAAPAGTLDVGAGIKFSVRASSYLPAVGGEPERPPSSTEPEPVGGGSPAAEGGEGPPTRSGLNRLKGRHPLPGPVRHPWRGSRSFSLSWSPIVSAKAGRIDSRSDGLGHQREGLVGLETVESESEAAAVAAQPRPSTRPAERLPVLLRPNTPPRSKAPTVAGCVVCGQQKAVQQVAGPNELFSNVK